MTLSTFRMTAAGDVMLGDSSHFIGRGVGSHIRKFGSRYPFERVTELIKPADLFFANLESPLAVKPGAKSWDKVYRGAVEAAAGLSLAGQNVVSVANNHILEHGREILQETYAGLARESIGCAGYGAGDVGDNTIWRGVVNDVKVVLFAVSLIRDFHGSEVDPVQTERYLLDSISGSTDELVIVSIHWGDEYVGTPSPEQVALGHRLVEAGAKVVLGHHPHVLQPVEEYRGGLIAYSLGNFVFDQDWSPQTRGGGLLNLTLSQDGVVAWDFVPTVADRNCRPLPASGQVASDLTAVIAGNVGVTEKAYRDLVARQTGKHRIRMKFELLRNFWRVTPATIHFLFTKRSRPRPCPGDKSSQASRVQP